MPKPIEISRYVMGGVYTFAGIMHFVAPSFYVQIIPDYLEPLGPMLLVYLSGVAEIVCGVGLFIPKTRRLAAWATIALLVAVFPANLYMATHNVQIQGLPSWMEQPGTVGRWMRLPFQAVFIWWAWLFTKPDRAAGTSAATEA